MSARTCKLAAIVSMTFAEEGEYISSFKLPHLISIHQEHDSFRHISSPISEKGAWTSEAATRPD